MAAPAPTLQVGEVLAGRYKLVEEIGRGGFGVVYRATQLGMNRDVAVKLLHASGPPGQEDQMRERFRREAMMARNLNHPHTIRQYDFGETDDGMMYLVLEFLEGKNLVETIRTEGALGDQRVRRMAEGVLKSLSEAHAQGIVHRDLKPANIMLCNVYGEKDYVKVLDFGIAKTMMGDTDLTAAGVALGSPRYMAPELLRGDNPTPGSDVYAVAITFAEAVTGKPLLRVDNSVEAAQMQLSPKPLPIPDELRASTLYPWLSLALKKDESERYQSAEEMLRYLRATPEELAARGADFGEEELETTQIPKIPAQADPNAEVETFVDQPMAMEGLQEDESDPEAPTIRIDSNDIDAYLASRGHDVGPAAANAPVETSDETAPNLSVSSDFAKTNPSQDTLSRPQFDSSSEIPSGLGGIDDNRQTSPLPSISKSSPDLRSQVFGGGRPQHDSGHSLQIGGGGDTEQPTQMVTIDEAFGTAPAPNTFDSDPAGQQGIGGDMPTQMIPVEQGLEEPVYRTKGANQHQTSPAGGPQISGQAFSESGLERGATTQHVNAVAGDRSGAASDTRKKYIIYLAVFVFIGLLGFGALMFLVVQMMNKGSSEIPDTPTVNTPTPTEPAAATVEFKVFTTPPGAALIIDGSEKGATPAKFSLPESRLPIDIELVLEGHESRKITLQKNGEVTFDLKLEALPQPEEPKPEPKPEPKAEEPEPKPKPRPQVNKPKPKPKPKPKNKKPVIEIWD